MTDRRHRLKLLISIALTSVATSHASAQDVALIEQSGSWSLFASDTTPRQMCFIASQPKETEPKGANRASIYFYVSAWPKDGVRNEISVRLGYPIRKASAPKVTVGPDVFELFAKDDRAFVADATSELKLIDAMRKGTTLIVQATSERGTATTDTYSLSGVSSALQKLAATCP